MPADNGHKGQKGKRAKEKGKRKGQKGTVGTPGNYWCARKLAQAPPTGSAGGRDKPLAILKVR